MIVDDDATRREEQERERALAEASQKAKDGPAFTGRCLYCTDPVPAPRRWCGAECRDDWEREQRAR